MANKTATFIKDQTSEAGASQKVYKVSEPVRYGDDQETNHILVYAAETMLSGPETFIYPASAEGNILDSGVLVGLFMGLLDHTQALTNAGYKIV